MIKNEKIVSSLLNEKLFKNKLLFKINKDFIGFFNIKIIKNYNVN